MNKLDKFKLAEGMRLLAVHLQGMEAAIKQIKEILEKIK